MFFISTSDVNMMDTREKKLTASPRSPVLPDGPKEPGAPGAPGGPGGPAFPLSPRSPYRGATEGLEYLA